MQFLNDMCAVAASHILIPMPAKCGRCALSVLDKWEKRLQNWGLTVVFSVSWPKRMHRAHMSIMGVLLLMSLTSGKQSRVVRHHMMQTRLLRGDCAERGEGHLRGRAPFPRLLADQVRVPDVTVRCLKRVLAKCV